MKTKMRLSALKSSIVAVSACMVILPWSAEAQSQQDIIKTNIQDMLEQKSGTAIVPLADFPVSAASADLSTAAYYAWQQFIALNWANVPVQSINGSREKADTSKKFGQPADGVNGISQPGLVWETTRHRVEVYPGNSNNPNGYNTSDPSFGYDALPAYQYKSPVTVTSNGPTPWINLDENSQIGVDYMYTGYHTFGDFSTPPGRFVLFLAKANRNEYIYSASRQWFGGNPGSSSATVTNTAGYLINNLNAPPPGETNGSSNPGKYVSFPNDTFEFKAAWRVLTETELFYYKYLGYIPGGYHVAKIRYYLENGSGYTAHDTYGALLGLHINHKTASAPYFTFATFEHYSNIRDAQGNSTEDLNGNLTSAAFTPMKPSPPHSGYVEPTGTSNDVPVGMYLKNPTSPNVVTDFSQYDTNANTITPQLFIPTPDMKANSYAEIESKRQSFYANFPDTPQASANSDSPYIAVERRRFPIPQDVVDVNSDVHNSIATSGYGGNNNVWLNYKLVNVQWKPASKAPGVLYTETDGVPPATYYQSNSMIETDVVLSAFSGQFNGLSNAADTITDYYTGTKTYKDSNTGASTTKKLGDPFYNIYNAGVPHNMGGCMGCHGNAAVSGNDSSFIFDLNNYDPDVATPYVPANKTPSNKMSSSKGY